MGYIFSKSSLKELDSCHPDLKLIACTALQSSQVDFKITEGHRTRERQNELYKEGLTTIDGIKKKGKHNYSPSRAFDIAVVTGSQLSWDRGSLIFLAGVILSVGSSLYVTGAVSHKLRWGGNWDGDGIIIKDQNFIDLPHFELLNVKK